MGEARAPRLGVADERNRAPDAAQRPPCERETKHRRDAGVVYEPESQIVVAPRLKQGERALQMILRFAVLASEPMRDSSNAVGDTGLSESGLASTSLRSAVECSLIAANSPRT
jgi:hypothetical protein